GLDSSRIIADLIRAGLSNVALPTPGGRRATTFRLPPHQGDARNREGAHPRARRSCCALSIVGPVPPQAPSGWTPSEHLSAAVGIRLGSPCAAAPAWGKSAGPVLGSA